MSFDRASLALLLVSGIARTFLHTAGVADLFGCAFLTRMSWLVSRSRPGLPFESRQAGQDAERHMSVSRRDKGRTTLLSP